jgi:imidazolonepropionase-like amidohydrolase
MKSQGILLVFTLTMMLTAFSCNDPHPYTVSEDTTALTNAVLIDGTGSEPALEMTILIQGSRINRIGPGSDITVPANATTIDLAGAYVLPGFFNAHIHRGFNESNLQAWARAGVTTVRDIGANPNQPLFSMRDDFAANDNNARLVCAGPMVTVPNGYPIIPWGSSTALTIESIEEAHQEIGGLLNEGADLIKIALERGDIFGEVIPTLSAELAAEIVEFVHDRGTVVSAHILASRDLELALEAGVDDIAHMAADYVPDDLLLEMVNDDVYWVPTLELWHAVGYNFGEIAIDNLRRFVQAGGNVALGTDYAGYSAPFELGMPTREIGWMREAGMTPMQIIVAGTRNAAVVCNLEDELGTVEAGKIADLLVVNSNPLEGIEEALTDVRYVFHNGAVVFSTDDH